MKGIQIRHIRTEELSFVNKMEHNSKLSISSQYSYNVRYAKENLCRGEFTAKVVSKEDPERFSIGITLIGLFAFEEGISKEDIHRATYEQLFPYVRAAVTNLTANAGIPPIYIPIIDITGQSVYRIELPHKE